MDEVDKAGSGRTRAGEVHVHAADACLQRAHRCVQQLARQVASGAAERFDQYRRIDVALVAVVVGLQTGSGSALPEAVGGVASASLHGYGIT